MSVSLSSIFSNIAHKRLVAVDLPNAGSNQHELNGVLALREFFGNRPLKGAKLTWYYFADDQDPVLEDGTFTFYDARARSAKRTGRSEWRFYYAGSFLSRATVEDWLILARTHRGEFIAMVFQNGSGWMRAAQALFAIPKSSPDFESLPRSSINSREIRLLQARILAGLDLTVPVPASADDEELIVKKFGKEFPKTWEMSEFARNNVEVDISDPDQTLVRWLEREEELFRALENVIILKRINRGFTKVDDFIGYSLSVQNRRKSRMGFALQNHLAELFTRQKLSFTAQARTEGNNKPDFIFPGESEYHDKTFDASRLVMLGVKSTAKDRWRQVLVEADRIPAKHLCTLEPGISKRQTDEMKRQNLTLVLPAALHETYSAEQQNEILAVREFIEFVRRKQA